MFSDDQRAMRTTPLGQDRLQRSYFVLQACPRLLLVNGPDANAWHAFTSPRYM